MHSKIGNGYGKINILCINISDYYIYLYIIQTFHIIIYNIYLSIYTGCPNLQQQYENSIDYLGVILSLMSSKITEFSIKIVGSKSLKK